MTEALSDHYLISTERSVDSVRLIFLESDVGKMGGAVSDVNFTGGAAIETKADEDWRVSKVAYWEEAVSDLLLKNSRFVRDGFVSIFRGKTGSFGALSVPVVPSVASSIV